MNTVAQSDVSEVIFQLLKETFEGPAPIGPSAFIEKGTGLFQTLEGVSAELASTPARAEGSTVAAHTEHIRFYLAVHHKLMLSVAEHVDWTESWRIKTVDAAEWDDLKERLQIGYGTVMDHLRNLDRWGENEISLAMSIIAHTAYHLGAIRQLVLVAQKN
ncbi:MAG TPA: hypothetical protein VGQ41_25605 [Pyrinomonadaceae bacterium]|jgi:hypothetical protein|nr:hypothetical protein [Pyrinomonadaceae bacterium]